jgi:hypothetical protein
MAARSQAGRLHGYFPPHRVYGARRLASQSFVACAARNVKVLTLRRCANEACAEHAFALLLALAEQLHRVNSLISAALLAAAGYAPTTFDGRHVPTSGWARITGLKILSGGTLVLGKKLLCPR